jgi:hypothetical protein
MKNLNNHKQLNIQPQFMRCEYRVRMEGIEGTVV